MLFHPLTEKIAKKYYRKKAWNLQKPC